MKVLITGGAGFIGSHLTDRLIAKGNQVYVIDNFLTGSQNNLPDMRKENNLFIVDADIFKKDLVEQVFSSFKPDVVIHAAASYKDPDNWYEDANTNCAGGVNVIKASMKHKVKRFIYFQTSCAYGHNPDENPITTECALKPDTSSYAITKTTTEYFLYLSGLDYVVMRLANCYGPRTKTGPVAAFYKKLSKGETCVVMNTRRDYVYIDDLCTMVIRAIDGEGTKGVYHISTGSDYAIEELYYAMAKIMEVNKEPIKKERGEDDTYTLLIDPSKSHRDFPGWKATTPLGEGLKKTIEYYKENPPDIVYTHLRMKK